MNNWLLRVNINLAKVFVFALIFCVGTEVMSTISTRAPWGYYGAFSYSNARLSGMTRSAFQSKLNAALDHMSVSVASCASAQRQFDADGGMSGIKTRVYKANMAAFDRSVIFWPVTYFIFLILAVILACRAALIAYLDCKQKTPNRYLNYKPQPVPTNDAVNNLIYKAYESD